MIPKTIKGGVYLVVDPLIEVNTLLFKLKEALEGGISVVQVWNNWPDQADKKNIIEKICLLATLYEVPVLINEDRRLLCEIPLLSGIHFDLIPEDLEELKRNAARPFLCGITCSNDLATVRWAGENDLDYLSFCSMFPSSSAGACEIVMPETVRKAGLITKMPVFLAGGITPEKITELKETIPFDGVAAISGIMTSDDPKQKVSAYLNALNI